MRLADRILNRSHKKQKWIEACIVLFIFLGVSIRFGGGTMNWVWADYPYFAILIACLALVLVLIWVKVERNRIQKTIDLISGNSEFHKKRDLLTGRQQQVFDLIIQGKSNKEISSELFIELSTLKTHINHIYKTLNVNSRKNLRALKNS